MKFLNVFLSLLFATPFLFSLSYYFVGKEEDIRNWSYLNVAATFMTTLIFLGLFLGTPLLSHWNVRLLALPSLDLFWGGEINKTSSVFLLLCLCLNFFCKFLARSDVSFDPLSHMRFFFYADLFLLGLFISISANYFFSLFFGWELLGISSYLLLNFSYENRFSNNTSFTAFLYDQIGGFALLLGGAWLVFFYGDMNFSDVQWNLIKQSPVGICFLISIFCRLFQFGFNNWIAYSKEISSDFLSFSGNFMLGIPAFFLLWRLDLLGVPCFKLVSLYLGGLTFIFALSGMIMDSLLKKKGMYLTVAYWGLILILSAIGFYKFSFACVLVLSVAQFIFFGVEKVLSLRNNESFYNWEPNPHIGWFAGLMVFWALLHSFLLWNIGLLSWSGKGLLPWAVNSTIFILSLAIWRPVSLLCSIALDNTNYTEEANKDKVSVSFFLFFSFILLVVAFLCFWVFLSGNSIESDRTSWVKTSTFLGAPIVLCWAYSFFCKGTHAMLERSIDDKWKIIEQQASLEKLLNFALIRPFKWISVLISEKIDGFLIEEQGFQGLILFLRKFHQVVGRFQTQDLSFYLFSLLLGALSFFIFFAFKP